MYIHVAHNVYMYIYIYIHVAHNVYITYMYIHMHIYIYIHIHTYIHTYMYTDTYTIYIFNIHAIDDRLDVLGRGAALRDPVAPRRRLRDGRVRALGF